MITSRVVCAGRVQRLAFLAAHDSALAAAAGRLAHYDGTALLRRGWSRAMVVGFVRERGRDGFANRSARRAASKSPLSAYSAWAASQVTP